MFVIVVYMKIWQSYSLLILLMCNWAEYFCRHVSTVSSPWVFLQPETKQSESSYLRSTSRLKLVWWDLSATSPCRQQQRRWRRLSPGCHSQRKKRVWSKSTCPVLPGSLAVYVTRRISSALRRETLDSLRSKTEKALKVRSCWEQVVGKSLLSSQRLSSLMLAKQPYS